MKKLTILPPILLVLLVFVRFLMSDEQKQFTEESNVSTITLSIVGDIMCHSPQYEFAQVGEDSFDFNPVFRMIKGKLSESDFTFGNLETVTAGKNAKYSGYPNFNTPAQLLDALREAGFDLLTSANNHSLDRGESGILKTIEEMKARHIKYNGTFTNQSDRDSVRIFNIKGISIAFLAYSYGTNGNTFPKGKSYLLNLIDFDLIKKDIEKAKSQKPDLVLIHYHFGDEYQREPNLFQKEVVAKSIAMGADIIIGGHPHVLQPFQFLKSTNGNLDSVFIAYSLGNFISNQRKRYTDAGGILTLEIKKNTLDNKTRISKVKFTPTWVFKGRTAAKNEFVIVPSITAQNDNSILQYLKHKDLKKLEQSITDSKSILTKYNTTISFN
ncbi:MAG: CapA family protein [Ignavibacteriaceae bacterium]|nr:CapA family protein [Ignavibacteriaceae bacterium]